MPEFTDERCQLLNHKSVQAQGRYVLYWMQMYKRSSHNFALNKAIDIANQLKLPLVVYEGLKYYYPWASDRIHTFILEGIQEKYKAFTSMGIRYIFYLQENKDSPRNTVADLCKDAAVLVTDDFPCFIIPEHNKHITERVKLPVYAVDSNGMIPLRRFTKEEYAARTIRPKVNKLLPEYTDELKTPKLHNQQPLLEVNCPETVVDASNIAKLVAGCDIDHSVTAVSSYYKGGEQEARKRMQFFINHLLLNYDSTRNKPTVDGSSRLSSYLHFGFISPQEIYQATLHSDVSQEAKNVFIEELIVRRELSYNLTFYNPNYDSLQAAPDWGKRTMYKHAKDKRPILYTSEQLEFADTHDQLWNACQQESLKSGEIHNYMRMLWGKKMIQWMPTYEEAFEWMVHLNNKYSLDGRNPNSYTGILWCFGKHDRAWGPERNIFGTLRYLSSDSWRKKMDAKEYIEKWCG